MTSAMTSHNPVCNESTTALRPLRDDSPQNLILRPGLGSPGWDDRNLGEGPFSLSPVLSV